MIIPVLVSGGNGTRLWPLSTQNKPKQFIELINKKTLFSFTLERFKNKNIYYDPIIISNIKYLDLIKKELAQNKINNSLIITEFEGRNTAPAICSVINHLYKNDKEAIVLFAPSDAFINDINKFQQAILEGYFSSIKNKIITFAIKPTHPATAYGYIKLGTNIINNTFEVDSFKEKPTFKIAKKFICSKQYYWNSGIIMGKVSSFYKLFLKYQNKLSIAITDTLKNSTQKENILYLNPNNFNKCENISIDYAIMEALSSNELNTITMDLYWNDLGSYSSLYDCIINNNIDNIDNNIDNIINGKTILNNVMNSYINIEKSICVCSDIKNLVIIEKNNVLFIMNKEKDQNIKEIINNIKNSKLDYIL